MYEELWEMDDHNADSETGHGDRPISSLDLSDVDDGAGERRQAILENLDPGELRS